MINVGTEIYLKENPIKPYIVLSMTTMADITFYWLRPVWYSEWEFPGLKTVTVKEIEI